MQDVQWSTDKVLQQTLAQAEQLHLKVAPLDTLPTLRDIDTLQVSVIHMQCSYIHHFKCFVCSSWKVSMS